jgi:hypothetical protein
MVPGRRPLGFIRALELNLVFEIYHIFVHDEKLYLFGMGVNESC